jgi:cobalt-precorrin-5B (C1)-methyltransferase
MVFDSYVVKNGKKLRRGYTTGSTATAAAKAATYVLFTGKRIAGVEIDTPAGIKLDLEVDILEIKEGYVTASVLKDGGDDPDATDGIEIIAKVEEIESGIELLGGKGVGQVTKPGLAVKVGKPAINPVPRKMLKTEINKVLPADKGVRVTIEVPEGEKIAKKTFNPKLGIIGGISILGTTGIVEPMSEKAYCDSLAINISQAVALGEEELILVFGNYGKRMAIDLGFREEQIIRMSNFVGFMLKECVARGVKKIILLGHIGKLVKVGAGIFNTHSHLADARLETIAAYTASIGGSRELINGILKANTAEDTIEMIKEAGFEEVFNVLAKRVSIRAEEHVDGELEVKSLLFSMQGEILGRYGGW